MKFTSILKSIILENAKLEFLTKKYLEPKIDKEGKKIKPELTPEIFFELIQADPKTNMNNVNPNSDNKEEWSNIHPGGYSEWIVKNYLNPDLEEYADLPKESSEYKAALKRAREEYIEDLSQINIDLQKFLRFKNKIEGEKDINKLTPRQLYRKVVNFSLEKTKASREEKEKAVQSFIYPGAEILKRGKNFTLVRITDSSELGRQAACFYGGYQLRADKGETTWCTSSPGYDTNFKTYIKDGPLYVFIKNEDTKFGEKSKLPAERYQFHFPSNQFKDVHNDTINVIDFLNGPALDLKFFFKKEFAKGLTIKGEELKVDNFTSGLVGKYIALYGLEDLFDSLPNDLNTISIYNKEQNSIQISLPESISRFKNLGTLVMRNCLKSLPNSICELKQLNFITLIDNKELTEIPSCIATELPNLVFVNLQGSMNAKIPPIFNERGKQWGDRIWDFDTEEEEN